jgi:hypothetical protein
VILDGLAWIAQGYLAKVFAWHGYVYLTKWEEMARRSLRAQAEAEQRPIESLSSDDLLSSEILRISYRWRYLIGATEVAAAVGLIAPGVLDVEPELTPWAATGLATIMTMSSALHLREGRGGDADEYRKARTTVRLLALCVFVAAVRFGPEPL